MAHICKTGFNSDSKRSSATEAVTKFRSKENRKYKKEAGEIKTISSGIFKGFFSRSDTSDREHDQIINDKKNTCPHPTPGRTPPSVGDPTFHRITPI